MKIDIYRSKNNKSKYISVEAGNNPTDFNINKNDADYNEIVKDRMGFEISPDDKKRVAIDSDEIITAIEKQGYCLHGATAEGHIVEE